MMMMMSTTTVHCIPSRTSSRDALSTFIHNLTRDVASNTKVSPEDTAAMPLQVLCGDADQGQSPFHSLHFTFSTHAHEHLSVSLGSVILLDLRQWKHPDKHAIACAMDAFLSAQDDRSLPGTDLEAPAPVVFKVVAICVTLGEKSHMELLAFITARTTSCSGGDPNSAPSVTTFTSGTLGSLAKHTANLLVQHRNLVDCTLHDASSPVPLQPTPLKLPAIWTLVRSPVAVAVWLTANDEWPLDNNGTMHLLSAIAEATDGREEAERHEVKKQPLLILCKLCLSTARDVVVEQLAPVVGSVAVAAAIYDFFFIAS